MNIFNYKTLISNKRIEEKDIVIFDDVRWEIVKGVIPKNCTYYVYKYRTIIIYLDLKVLLNFLVSLTNYDWKLFFRVKIRVYLRELICHYHLACIRKINPRIVITRTDNSYVYHWLSNNLEGTQFFAIQNGIRTPEQLEKSFKYRHQHFFCFGENEIEKYHKFGHKIKHAHSIGSLISDIYQNSDLKIKRKSIKYIIGIISQFSINLINNQGTYSEPYLKSEKQMHAYISRYIKEKKVRALLMMRFNDSHIYSVDEYNYYFRYYKDFVDYRKNDQDSFSTYRGMDESEIIISFYSTSSLEAFGFGKKILHCDFTDSKLYNDYDPCIMFTNSDYNQFESRMNHLIDQPYEKYDALVKKYRKKVMNNSEQISTELYIRNKIKDTFSNKI